MNEKTYHIKGIAPTLMHNGRLSNPMDTFSREMKTITGKRKKTDEDFFEISRLEFLGSLYMVGNGSKAIGWPSENLESMILAAARLEKMGRQAKPGIFIYESPALIYDGPKDPEKLWEIESFRDIRRVKVGQSSVMRTRPIFHQWELKFTVQYEPNIVDAKQIDRFVEEAGIKIGLSDYRPKYGRFEVLS